MIVAGSAWWVSCGPQPETSREAPRGKEAWTEEGKILARQGEWDAATVALRHALQADSAYTPALLEWGALHELRAAREGEKGRRRVEYLRTAREAYARVETLGGTDADVYEHLCELSTALEDKRGFLAFARKYAARYPFDRQYYNLGLAYYGAEDFQNVIKSQKDAIERFPSSAYLGGFHRQLGRAYLKIDRDQTAERTLTGGVQAVDARLTALRAAASVPAEDVQRLRDDKVGMLLLLKQIHQLYKADAKLQQVERQLREAGAQGR
jgi:tetratricopeptide (TPR) repeat protein